MIRLGMLALLLFSFCTQVAFAKVPTVEIGTNKVKLEVAASPEQIQRGLMYRTSLAEDHGMVFLFHPQDSVRFWMAHCFISLDMLFIKDGKIVKIFENVPPCKEANETDCPTYPNREEAPVTVNEVVEVSAGYAKRHSIKEGDSVTFSFGGNRKSGKKTSSSQGQSE